MQQITKYQTKDGEVFDDEASALKHENKLLVVEHLYKLLNPIPDGCAFLNGDGFVQQDEKRIREYKRMILIMAGEKTLAENPDEVEPMGYIGRMLCDTDGMLWEAWQRLMCIDSQFREWGQPYYARS